MILHALHCCFYKSYWYYSSCPPLRRLCSIFLYPLTLRAASGGCTMWREPPDHVTRCKLLSERDWLLQMFWYFMKKTEVRETTFTIDWGMKIKLQCWLIVTDFYLSLTPKCNNNLLLLFCTPRHIIECLDATIFILWVVLVTRDSCIVWSVLKWCDEIQYFLANQ